MSQIVGAVENRAMRDAMIAGTVGSAAGAEFMAVADEIAALVAVDDLIATPRSRRAEFYPETLNGLVGLIYAVIARADAETMPAVIDILADLPGLRGEARRALPLAELASFGFELLIRKALNEGLAEAFRHSESYAAYAAERKEAGAL